MTLPKTHNLLATLLVAGFCTSAVQAAEPTAAEVDMATRWAKAADTDKDHLLSKAEVIALIDKAFANAEAKNAGKLDMKQVAVMLREFDPRAAGVKPSSAKP